MDVQQDSGEAMYLQIARALRQQIIDGELAVGDRLPSGREIWKGWSIGRNTYSDAIRELKREGLVATRTGQGTFVVARPELRIVLLRPGDQVVARAPTEQERAAHGMGLLTPVLVITRTDGAREVHSAAVTVLRSAEE